MTTVGLVAMVVAVVMVHVAARGWVEGEGRTMVDVMVVLVMW